MFYTQGNRLMKVTTPLGPNVLLLTGFRGHEAISELFCFELDLIASRFIPVPFENILGQPITAEIALPNGTTRYFNGIVSRFSQGSRDDTFTHFKARMVPKFWLFTKRAQSRIFQRKTIPEILETVLDGLDVSLEFTGAYEPRDYCVQYRETDFAFASRLMEEEGISYCFGHSDEGHRMLVSDSSLQLPDVPGSSIVVFDDIDDGLRDDARVSSWEKSQQVCSTEYSLWDHCFELPDQNLEAKQSILESIEAGVVTHKLSGGDETFEVYDYPGTFAQRFDGVEAGGGDRAADLTKIFEDNKRTVKLRMEEEAAQSIQINGRSNCVQLTPGHKFTLVKHFNADGQYLLTRVEHVARLATEYRSGEEAHELEYENSFTCIPQSLPYRPGRVTPKPMLAGVQTATVVGPEGQHIFVDKYGRVKVQFHWDRQGKMDADSSCWIRVAQFWAGPRWGAFFWPRIGHEVVVAFAEGDPDQPVIVGNVYNAANMPPLSLPEHKEAGGIKSCTVGEESAEKFNSVIFHDHAGDEHVHIHSETHEAFTSEGSKFSRTPGPHIQVCGTLPFGLGSGGGGGVDDRLGESCLIAMAHPIAPDEGSGSGAGGGMLEWPAAIGEFCDSDWIKWCTSRLPGSSKFVFGSQTNATMLGDRNAHILVGADVRIVVDLEAMATDAIMGSLKAGFMASQIVGGLGGAGGSTAFICGPNSTLTYAGDQLSVVRGNCYQLRSKGAGCPTAKAAKLLAVAAALATMAADIVAAGHLKHKKSLEGSAWERWAALGNTALSAVPSRLLALLIGFETEDAKLQADALKAAEAVRLSAVAVGEALQASRISLVEAKTLIRSAERRVTALVEDEAANSAKVFQGDYNITAHDISLVSQSDGEGSDIHLEARGNAEGERGCVLIEGTQTVEVGCVGESGEGGAGATFANTGAGAIIGIANNSPGNIEIRQGALPVDAGSPGITLSEEPPSIKLQVGLPEVGSCLELTPLGLTAKFGLFSITMNELGIKLGVLENSIQLTEADIGISALDSSLTLTPASVTTSSPVVTVSAESAYSLSSEMVQLSGGAVVNVVGAIICLN